MLLQITIGDKSNNAIQPGQFKAPLLRRFALSGRLIATLVGKIYMERKHIKTLMIKSALIFGAVYALVWFASGLIIYPVDFLYEHFTGIEFVDGWTPGVMVWTASIFIIPIIFLLVMLAVYLKVIKQSAES